MVVKPLRWRFSLWFARMVVGALVVCALGQSGSARPKDTEPGKTARKWHGVHLLSYSKDADLERLAGDLPKLAEKGITFVILEVDYHFEFQSHPELRQGDKQISKAGARKFAAACRQHNIRVIPEFQCVGHQSWAKQTFPLLTKYPQLDLTPGAFPKNEGLYCREWDVNNPAVYKIVFKLLDEIIDAFQADAFHIGADEVFQLGSDKSPSTKGQDPAKLYAKAINDLHHHLVKERKVEMLMWGDRLIDANRFQWGEWEASKNGTAPAVDLIPKDIILCPWHYEPMKGGYPSIPMFIEKGFRVLPTSWRKLDALKMLIEYSYQQDSPKMLGHLFTIWGRPRGPLPEYPPMVEGLKLLKTLEDGRATARTLAFTTTQVTDADLAVSPNGKQLVFTLLGHLFSMPVKGGAAEQLTFGACYDNDPAFSPDGRYVAFVSDRDGSGGNVFLLELATSKLTPVTHESQAGQPTWAPDGKALLYLRFLPREEDPRPASIFGRPALCDLRKMPLGSDCKPETLRGPGLLRSVFYLSGGQPAWTVLEQETAAGSFFARSTTHLETIPPKEGKVVRLRSAPGDLGRVAGSPKGDGVYLRTPVVRFLPLPAGPAPRVPAFPGGGSATRFAVTADGKTVYLSDRGQLVKVTLDSGEREVLNFSAPVKLEVADPVRPKWTPPEAGGAVRAHSVLGPELSPNGRSFTFMAAGYLWQQSLDGRPARRLLGGDAWEREPALSPDGRQLAFVRSHHGKRALRVLDLESGHTRTLIELGDDSWARFPSWSADGKRLVFQRSGALQSFFALVSVNVSDGKLEQLASPAGDWSSRPHFSIEGDALYFTSRMGGPGSLYRLPLKEGNKPEAVTHLARHLNDARVSPDGKWLAFRRNTEIWLAPLGSKPINEKNLRRLSPEGGATFGFTADASAVVYSVGRRVWRHPLDGGERQAIPVRLEWRSPTPPSLLFRRVRVLDFAAGQFSPETSLLVERGAIRWIGSEREHKLPEGVAVLDAAGRYAIPGLFDFHVHSAWANYEANPDTFLAYGVTSVRDTGGSLETLSALAGRGAITGNPVPRYFFSGEIFEGAQPIWGDAFLQIYTAEDARNHVKRWKERGAHFIKVYPSLPWPLQRAVAEEARRQGLPVAGHGLGLEEIVKSVTLGYVSLEHCPMSLNGDVQQMLAAAGTRCDPTLAILGGHSNLLRREPKRLDDAKLHAFFSESFIRASRGGGFPGVGVGWPGRLAQLRAAHRAGIKLHAGTDSLMVGTFFGASLHWELEHLAEAGLKPLEVLRLATEEAAVAVGADGHLGTLAPGKLADIVLLDADPLEKIRNTQAIWRVVKGGWVFDPKELRPTARASPGDGPN